jgi:choline dehydrogenase
MESPHQHKRPQHGHGRRRHHEQRDKDDDGDNRSGGTTVIIRSASAQIAPPEPMPCEFDYIVVGAGGAGVPLAMGLSSDPARSVLLIEYGENRDSDPRVLNYLASFGNSFDQAYTRVDPSLPMDGTEGQTDDAKVGRMWGGSTGVNYQVWARGSAGEWDALAQTVGQPALWGYGAMVPSLRASENYTGPTQSPGQRGVGGPINVIALPIPPAIAEPAALGALQAFGVAPVVDLNAAVEMGSGAFQMSLLPGGAGYPYERQSSSITMLTPDVVRPDGSPADPRRRRLWVASRARADRVHLERDSYGALHARGVHYLINGRTPMLARATRRVVLSSSFHSAGILERSGVGNAAVLAPLGIPTVVPNLGVGDNFFTQVGGNMYVAVDFDVNELLVTPDNPIGFMFQVLAPDPTRPDDGIRRWYVFASTGIQFYRQRPPPGIALDPSRTISFNFWQLDPLSRGSVHVSSSDPTVAPRVDLGLYADPRDVTSNMALARAIREMVRSIATTFQGGTRTFTMAYPNDAIIDDDAQLERWLRTDYFTAAHYHGACSMGSVVDGLLRVAGVAGLSVCDTSVFSVGMGAGTGGAAIGLGVRYANILKTIVEPAERAGSPLGGP